MPQRESRAAWPQMRIVGLVMGSAAGMRVEKLVSRRRRDFCAEESGACMGCKARVLRYADEKARYASVVCG